MDSSERFNQLQLSRNFQVDQQGNTIWFPWGKYWAGYVLPPFEDAASITRKKNRFNSVLAPFYVLVTGLAYSGPKLLGQNYLLICLSVLILIIAIGVLHTCRNIRGYVKSNEKYKGTHEQRVADYSDAYTAYQLKLKFVAIFIAGFIGIVMCCASGMGIKMVGALFLVGSIVTGRFIARVMDYKTKNNIL